MFEKIGQWMKSISSGPKAPVAQEFPNAQHPRGHYFDIDGAEVVRLRDEKGWSFRKIGRHMGHSAATVLQRYQEQRAHLTAVEPPHAEIVPETAKAIPVPEARPEPPQLPAALLSGLGALHAAAPKPMPTPAPGAEIAEPEIAEESEVYGLESIKPGEPFFLLMEESQARQAHSYGQAAIVWPSWDFSGLAEYSAVQAAGRMYVLIPLRPFTPDTVRLLRALDRSPLRDKVFVAEIKDPEQLTEAFARRQEFQDKFGTDGGDYFFAQWYQAQPLSAVMLLVPATAPEPTPQTPQFGGMTPMRRREPWEILPSPSPWDGKIQ